MSVQLKRKKKERRTKGRREETAIRLIQKRKDNPKFFVVSHTRSALKILQTA